MTLSVINLKKSLDSVFSDFYIFSQIFDGKHTNAVFKQFVATN